MTGGIGVDHVVEVGGGGTLAQSIDAVRIGGHIAMIGVLTQGAVNPMPILRKSIRLNGIYVGSRAMFLDMNAAIEAGGLKPVIDRRFAFADAPDRLPLHGRRPAISARSSSSSEQFAAN